MIPPKLDGEFAANMEDVLEIYSQPYNKSIPVVCMDEQPIQLTREKRQPISATKKHARRVDYEYERAGTATIFMFSEPLAGKRQVEVRSNRTKKDWAIEIEKLVCNQYRDAEKIVLICDNLNTHTRGAFYEVFSAEKAHEIVKRLEFHYTPKHGSWLNIAECELSAMTRQCLRNRRFSDLEELRKNIQSWAERINKSQRGVNWQFTVDEARNKLRSIYPKVVS